MADMTVRAAVDAIIAARAALRKADAAKEWLIEEHKIQAGDILPGSKGKLVVTEETQNRIDLDSIKNFLGVEKYNSFLVSKSFLKLTTLKKSK